MTNCVRCARNLRAEPSIRRGAGPVCAKWLLRQVGWTGRVPRGWSAMSDVRVQRFLKRPLVSPDIPDEQAPIISTHGALEAIAPQARALESYSADELRLAAARVPKHLAAEYANEAYQGPNREMYQRRERWGSTSPVPRSGRRRARRLLRWRRRTKRRSVNRRWWTTLMMRGMSPRSKRRS